MVELFLFNIFVWNNKTTIMKAKSFIRVQDKFGRGMFQSGTPRRLRKTKDVASIDELSELSKRHNDFPNAIDDTKIHHFLLERCDNFVRTYMSGNFDYRFSFKNLAQFELWVTREEVKILKDYGYDVYRIEATDFCESEFQCVFNINSVTKIDKITDLFLD